MRFRQRWLPVIVAWGVATLFLLWQIGPTFAAGEFSYAIGLNYRLDGDGTTEVVTNYRVTNNTSNRILASLQISAPTSEVKDLKATYADGSIIPTSVEEKSNDSLGYTYKYQEITLKFDRWPTGRGANQNFSLSYKTSELIDIKGPSKTFYVPSLAQLNDNENYTVSVSVPQNFGRLYSTGVAPDLAGADGNRLRYTFSSTGDLKKSTTLIFGDTTIYKADFAYPLRNTSGREQTFTVTLPPDTSNQKIFVNKLEPAPFATRLDADGNILADYRVPARTTITVHTDIEAQVRYIEYDLTKGGAKTDIPADIAKQYTGTTQYWQTADTQLVSKAKAAAGDKTKVVDIVRAIMQLTDDTLTYNNEKIKYNIRQGSSKALRDPGNAVCLEYSDLMIALLRSQGIPARMPVGYAYAGNLKQSKAVTDSLHSWVEAYVPGIGWMSVDPTWNEKFDTFGKSDLDHFTFALWGRGDSTPAAVMIDGKDQNYQYEDTTISYSQDFPQAVTSGVAGVRKFVLFPGLSLVRYHLIAPQQVAGDEYWADITQGPNRHSQALGSLAPRQAETRSFLSVGGFFLRPAELIFRQNTDSGQAVLAAATGPAELWPMWIILGLVAGLLLLLGLKWRAKYRTRRRAEADISVVDKQARLRAAIDSQAVIRERAGASKKDAPNVSQSKSKLKAK